MPKYRVYVREIETYELDMEAPDQKTAVDAALKIQGNVTLNSHTFDRDVARVQSLPEDADIDFHSDEAKSL
jgi:hypothetical protein